ncbi:hypothetical protein TVNIR_3572 [Thioalkalivibrio nitratireducens DSM 14787]|uniref:PBP domain-containing protein n=1 Tax=Thioalkalivibrio nitratireducens (strain DSM 14787 / UNIQEM 213 / ALEN2) TaxID=1255043 RepID=L0E1T4_THIND|nr:hypothetical protein [Thioalkalivibrio nitratireducens]AGA35202.1 hypothetical protein TVNIR_3572 [Thioalkalivibrio nitratireducens DSM 14787]
MGAARSRSGRIPFGMAVADATTAGGRMLATILAGVILVLLMPAASASDDVLVVGHADLSAETLAAHSVRAIFAMRQRSWPDGQAARVFVLPDDHPVHVQFTKVVLGAFPHQLRLAWDRQIFSGSGQAPQRVNSETEMVERVASTPGAVGYATREAINARVRIIPVE